MATFNETSSSNDGDIAATGSVWSSVRSATSGFFESCELEGGGTIVSVDNNGSGGSDAFVIHRGFISFDTSSIGSGATITSATLAVFLRDTGDVTDESLYIFQGTQSLPPLSSDYDNFNSTQLITPVLFSSLSTSGTVLPLNSAGILAINKTGTTKFCLRPGSDYNNIPPAEGTTVPWVLVGPTAAVPTNGCVLTVVTSSTPPPAPTSITPNTGSTQGGTSVTIGGSNFVSGCTVAIGGVPCTSVVFVSSTQLTAVTGPDVTVGAKNVDVTNPDTSVGTLVSGFTYTPISPSLVSILPGQGVSGGGTSVTLAGSGFSSGTYSAITNGVTFGGVAATGVSVTSDSSIVCVSPAGTAGTTVDVVVTNPGGATATLAQSFSYLSTPPASGVTGTQLIYDFTRKVWYTASCGEISGLCIDPSGGVPKVYALQSFDNTSTGVNPDGKLTTFFDESNPGVLVDPDNPGLGRGFLQTFPMDFGNPHTKKQFQFVRLVVNDVTAINTSVSVTQPWQVFAYVNNANITTPPIVVPLAVNYVPFNVMTDGTIDAFSENDPSTQGSNSIGELIGWITNPDGSPVVGDNIRIDIYYPTGVQTNTPTSGTFLGQPLHLPWAVYKIEIAASLLSQSKVEP